MGQTASTARSPDRPPWRVSRLTNLDRHRNERRALTSGAPEEVEQSLLESRMEPSQPPPRPRPLSLATLHRHISAEPDPAGLGSDDLDGPSSTRNEIMYEQEERPLMSMDDLHMSDAPITSITASPMPRRQSIFARLGERMAPRQHHSGTPRSIREQDRSGFQQSALQEPSDLRSSDNSSRRRRPFSMLGSLGEHFGSSAHPAQRRRLAPISRPIPIDTDESLHPDSLSVTRQPPIPDFSSTNRRPTSAIYPSEDRNTFMARARRSISGPFESLLRQPLVEAPAQPANGASSWAQNDANAGSSSREDSDFLLPPVQTGHTLDMNDHGLALSPPHERQDTPIPPTPGSWTYSWDRTANAPRPENRRLQNGMRGRSSRLIRRDDETPLSRILQLAAAAIAAQLSGNPDAMANMETIGDDHFDGGLNSFVQELNSVAGGSRTSPNGSFSPTQNAHLNFWRVFRFRGSNNDLTPNTITDAQGNEQRTVTLVVVGVRSVPSANWQREVMEPIDQSLDSFLMNPGMPRIDPSDIRDAQGEGQGSSSTFQRNASDNTPFSMRNPDRRDNRSRSPQRPRSSGQQAPDNLAQHSNRSSQISQSDRGFNSRRTSSLLSESQRRLSTTSMAQEISAHDLDELSNNRSSMGEREASETLRGLNGLFSDRRTRQRRRSNSQQARYRDFGAGSSRRNGTIDPDGGPVQGRSWLIYVVGTNLPADHPAFTTPSLFTDNPTYEDMMMLSQLLGQVRAPVATQADVAASGGVFRITSQRGDRSWTAFNEDGNEEIEVAAEEKCQICLEKYSAEQIVRKLNKCVHLFHRECIDEWLTTGRNSCPLCRGEGVEEKSRQAQPPTPPTQETVPPAGGSEPASFL